MIKADYIKYTSSSWVKVFITLLFLITLSAFKYYYPDLPPQLKLKEYYYKNEVLPEWMIYNRKLRKLPKAPYKNLKRKTEVFFFRGAKKYIYDFNRKGNLTKYSRGDSSNVREIETYLFDNNGLLDKIYEPGVDGQRGFYYHYKFDKYNRLIKVWTDMDEKGTRIEYPNDYECVEYPNRSDNLVKRIKWNKEGIILYYDADNHYGERYIYKYDTKSRIASSIRFSAYDTTSIDSSFYNQNLSLLCYKAYFKDTTKTGKLELYPSDKDEYVYGPDGYLLEQYNYNAAGQLERKHIYEHNKTPDYNEFIETIYFLLSKTVSKDIERYDMHNQLIWESDRIDFNGKITEEYERNRYSDTLLLEEVVRDRSFYYHKKYKYDKYGNMIETISFDSTGRVIERDHTFRKNEVIKDQLGRIISVRKYENSRLAMTYFYEYYDDEVKSDGSSKITHSFNWYVIPLAAGILCIIAFSYYLLKKRKPY